MIKLSLTNKEIDLLVPILQGTKERYEFYSESFHEDKKRVKIFNARIKRIDDILNKIQECNNH